MERVPVALVTALIAGLRANAVWCSLLSISLI
jgi:hypothetical protein